MAELKAEARQDFDKSQRLKHGKKILKSALKKVPEFKALESDEQEKIINELERGCNNKAIRRATLEKVKPRWWTNEYYCEIYASIVYKMAMNINPDSEVGSSHLMKLILGNRIKLSAVADMHSNELCPEKSYPIIQKMSERLHKRVEVKTTKRYKCPQCKKKEAQVQEKQLRSFDEGTNICLTCIHCGKRWIL